MSRYKVLWIDDEIERLETKIEDFYTQGIDIIEVKSAEKALEILKDRFAELDALVVDGLFLLDEDDSGDALRSTAFGKVAMALRGMKDAGSIVPWFIYSGQPGFRNDENGIVEIVRDVMFAGGKIFDKNRPEDFEELCSMIKHHADAIDSTRLKHKYPESFAAFDSEYFQCDRSRLVDVLLYAESDSMDWEDKQVLNCRQLFEAVLNACDRAGLLDDGLHKMIGGERVLNMARSLRYLTGEKVLLNRTEKIVGRALMSGNLFNRFESTRILINKLHHNSAEAKLQEDFGRQPSLLRSLIYDVVLLLRWYSSMIAGNADRAANVRSRTDSSSVKEPWYSGRCGERYEDGSMKFVPDGENATALITADMVTKYDLQEDDIIRIKQRFVTERRRGQSWLVTEVEL